MYTIRFVGYSFDGTVYLRSDRATRAAAGCGEYIPDPGTRERRPLATGDVTAVFGARDAGNDSGRARRLIRGTLPFIRHQRNARSIRPFGALLLPCCLSRRRQSSVVATPSRARQPARRRALRRPASPVPPHRRPAVRGPAWVEPTRRTGSNRRPTPVPYLRPEPSPQAQAAAPASPVAPPAPHRLGYPRNCSRALPQTRYANPANPAAC